MAIGPGGAGALGGFSQGFAQAFLQARSQKHDKEKEKVARDFSVFTHALTAAEQSGDVSAVADTLRMMGSYNQAGEKGGKKGKQGQQNIMHQFADMLEHGRIEQQGQPPAQGPGQATQVPSAPPEGATPTTGIQTNMVEQQGPPIDLRQRQTMTQGPEVSQYQQRPSLTVHRPFFRDPMQQQREHDEFLLRKQAESEAASYRRAVDVADLRAKSSEKIADKRIASAEKLKQESIKAAEDRDQNKLAKSMWAADDPEGFKAGGEIPDEYNQAAGDVISKTAEAKLSNIKSSITRRAEMTKQGWENVRTRIAALNNAEKRTGIYAKSVDNQERARKFGRSAISAKSDLDKASTRFTDLMNQREAIERNPDMKPTAKAAAIKDIDAKIGEAYQAHDNAMKALKEVADEVERAQDEADMEGLGEPKSGGRKATSLKPKSTAASGGDNPAKLNLDNE